MKIINDDFRHSRFEELYSYLETCDHRWLASFFKDRNDFREFLSDEDVRILVYADDYGLLCCVGILDEEAVLTVAFSKKEEYGIFLKDAEKLISDHHYTSIFFGFGDYSYGVYDQENPHLHELMVSNSYIVEATAYDIRYTEGNDKDMIRQYVDQIEAQKITVPFEICGRYRSLSKDIK